MLYLNNSGIKDKESWQRAEVTLPEYDWEKVCEETEKNPTWVHFGAGNIFRGFIAALQHSLLNQGIVQSGIIAADTFDYDIIEKIYKPFDNMTVLVSLLPDGTMKKEVIASVGKALRAGMDFKEDITELKSIFRKESLQMVSFTITEKGYALTNMEGKFFPFVEEDFAKGPHSCSHAMSVVTALLLERFQAGGTPIAIVSMDNCSHNGEKLRSSVLTVAQKWLENGFVTAEFIEWIKDENKVAFPWSMIDKITPRPAKVVEDALTEIGIAAMTPIITSKNTYMAPFVNAEVPEYLVIEDSFPNGRPPLEKAGVYLTDRDTVNNSEKMKVTTCLNPLHTALAIYGCLLGYDSIAEEMKDVQLRTLVEKMGYQEGMPVVVNPGIISPEKFIHEVLTERLPNPFIPDTPQRIASDTSQKVGIRFGETLKSYQNDSDKDPSELTYIPLVIAGWCRYLLAKDDQLTQMELSSDPMLEELTEQLSSVEIGKDRDIHGILQPILSDAGLFGVDLYKIGLGKKIEGMFVELIAGKGAVRKTLEKYCK